MESILTLYKTRILKERNMVVDSLADYLDDCHPLVTKAFQYIKLSPSLEIKTALNQEELSQLDISYNYCEVDNQDGKPFYYFIDALSWIAQDTIKLSLTLDVLNTFQDSLADGLSDKTEVIREHRDRFRASSDGRWMQKIDRIAEGYNYPLIKSKNYIIYQYPRVDWYNIFVSNGVSESEPIMRLTMPSKAVTAITKNYTGTAFINLQSRLTSFADDEETFYFVGNENNQTSAGFLCIDWGTPSETQVEYIVDMYKTGVDDKGKAVKCLAISITFHQGVDVYIDGYTYWYYDDLTFYKKEQLKFTGNDTTYGFDEASSRTYFMGFTFSGILHYAPASKISATALTDMLNLPAWADYYNVSAYEERETAVNAFSSSWQSDTLTQKIIAYPYAPFALSLNEDEYIELPSNYVIVQGYMLQKSIAAQTNTITYLPFTYFTQKFKTLSSTFSPSLIEEDVDNGYESKMLHSEFFSPKFVYDSFNYVWKMEEKPYVKAQAIADDMITINMRVSGSMLSEFSFTLSSWSGSDSGINIQTSDYDNVFVVSRNNELCVYSSSYLAYMREGFNYDQKKNALAAQQQTYNVIINALSTIGSAVATGLTKGFAAPALISSATSLSTSIGNAAYSETNRQQTQAETIKQLMNQNVSVSGCTDFDVMNGYTSNRLRFMIYELDDYYKESAYNNMRLYGYASIGRYKPDVTTRALYNYLQCVPDWGTSVGSGIPLQYRQLLTGKLEEGVTFYHVSPWSAIDYDFDQRYENWERNLLK